MGKEIFIRIFCFVVLFMMNRSCVFADSTYMEDGNPYSVEHIEEVTNSVTDTAKQTLEISESVHQKTGDTIQIVTEPVTTNVPVQTSSIATDTVEPSIEPLEDEVTSTIVTIVVTPIIGQIKTYETLSEETKPVETEMEHKHMDEPKLSPETGESDRTLFYVAVLSLSGIFMIVCKKTKLI